jgi:hypothetical protein
MLAAGRGTFYKIRIQFFSRDVEKNTALIEIVYRSRIRILSKLARVGINGSTISLSFLGIILRFIILEVFYLRFCLSTKCLS